MTRDSSHSYIHFHAPRFADLFEEFTTPPALSAASLTPNNTTTTNPNNSTSTPQPNTSGGALPHEDIHIPPHLQPPNPEDEEDVVPDQHAAFGIARALAARERERLDGGGGAGANREGKWRDFESLGALVRGVGVGEGEGRRREREKGRIGSVVTLR